ncbi:MAG: F0F1 ATP synthase subunit delta [Lachnospiraceae bacterium]|nr:F0F1 ATP synthase subunit delta [Lachnospiraceae bacterium]MBR6665751.1 F0F1 ATP synthase subunit delta [Lachnospiraceae bacterium]
MAKLISKTYGEALFEVAMEGQKTDLFLQEAQDILTILDENPDLDKLMKHPKVSRQEKEAVLDNVFLGNVSREMTGFMKLLINKDRYSELPKIFGYLIERIKEERKIGTAYVTTAVELTAEKKEAVKNRLLETTEYKTMEMVYEVDEAIIGGMIIRIKDRVVDSSVRTKLEEMKKQLLQIQLG